MKRVAVLGVALLASTCWVATRESSAERVGPLARVDAPASLGERAFAHVAELVSFGPRHTGSPGWQRGIDYIAAQFEAIPGLVVRRDVWVDEGERLTFTNIVATLPGGIHDKLLLGCHHDTKRTTGHPDPEHNFDFVGANDSGSGVGLVLALAAEIARTARPDATNRPTYEFVCFDGEESVPYKWDISRALFGSRRYVEQHEAAAAAPIRALILLDMVGAADLQIDRETESHPGLREIIRAAAEATGHASYFFAESLRVTDDHTPFLLAGIPAIDLIDIVDNPQWHTTHDTLDTISARSLQIVGEVVLTALPEIERRFVSDRPSRLELPPGDRR